MTGLSGYKGALTGIRVVDFSRIVAGPHCRMWLADLGAEVIKVADTGHGDDIRHHKPPEIKCDSPYFLSLNRNKSSIGIDFTSKDGKYVVHDLIATADILVENFRTGVMNVSTKNLSACERTVIIASETIIEMTSAYFSESDMRRVSA